MANQYDPIGDLMQALGWILLFAGIGAISVLGWLGYGLYSLVVFLI